MEGMQLGGRLARGWGVMGAGLVPVTGEERQLVALLLLITSSGEN